MGEIMTSTLLKRLGLAVATGLVATASLAAPAAASETGTGILQGSYATAGGTPLGYALISVWPGDGSDVYAHIFTDATGHYETTLPAGGYLLGFQSEYGVSQWSPGQVNRACATVYTVADGEILTVDEQEL